MKTIYAAILLTVSITICSGQQKDSESRMMEALSNLTDYDSLEQAEVMVLGVFHFDKSVLDGNNQLEISRLIQRISEYAPTKLIVEWEPELSLMANEQYQSYLKDAFKIADRPNEVYQLGFRLAKKKWDMTRCTSLTT